MNRTGLLPAVACCLILAGCNQNQPADPAKDEDAPEIAAQARAAATELAHERYPKETIQGVWVAVSSKPQNGYYAAVDMGTGPGRKRVNMVIRRFTSPQNTTYWRADTFSSELLSIYGSGPHVPPDTQTSDNG